MQITSNGIAQLESHTNFIKTPVCNFLTDSTADRGKFNLSKGSRNKTQTSSYVGACRCYDWREYQRGNRYVAWRTGGISDLYADMGDYGYERKNKLSIE